MAIAACSHIWERPCCVDVALASAIPGEFDAIGGPRHAQSRRWTGASGLGSSAVRCSARHDFLPRGDSRTRVPSASECKRDPIAAYAFNLPPKRAAFVSPGRRRTCFSVPLRGARHRLIAAASGFRFFALLAQSRAGNTRKERPCPRTLTNPSQRSACSRSVRPSGATRRTGGHSTPSPSSGATGIRLARGRPAARSTRANRFCWRRSPIRPTASCANSGRTTARRNSPTSKSACRPLELWLRRAVFAFKSSPIRRRDDGTDHARRGARIPDEASSATLKTGPTQPTERRADGRSSPRLCRSRRTQIRFVASHTMATVDPNSYHLSPKQHTRLRTLLFSLLPEETESQSAKRSGFLMFLRSPVSLAKCKGGLRRV
jgi:hypothetical protein